MHFKGIIFPPVQFITYFRLNSDIMQALKLAFNSSNSAAKHY